MKTNINGIDYLYEVISIPKKGKYHFSINAIHKLSRRLSTITTINPILSEFNVIESDRRCKKSIWEVNITESNSFVRIAKDILSDKYYQKYLEKVLDEDRMQSEWENLITYT